MAKTADLREMMEMQAAWVEKILPVRNVKRTVIKVTSETSELLEAVLMGTNEEIADEFADILILCLDVCKLRGIDPVEAFHRKLEINKARNWQESGGTLQHKETPE